MDKTHNRQENGNITIYLTIFCIFDTDNIQVVPNCHKFAIVRFENAALKSFFQVTLGLEIQFKFDSAGRFCF